MCGLPLFSGERDELVTLLQQNVLPTTILQNSNERFISPQELRTLLESFKNYHVITGEGKGHKYAAGAVAEAVRQHLRR